MDEATQSRRSAVTVLLQRYARPRLLPPLTWRSAFWLGFLSGAIGLLSLLMAGLLGLLGLVMLVMGFWMGVMATVIACVVVFRERRLPGLLVIAMCLASVWWNAMFLFAVIFNAVSLHRSGW